jgi:hypothetical protein
LQGPGKQSAEWQPSSFSLKPDESPNIVRHIRQQRFFSFPVYFGSNIIAHHPSLFV